jgi:bifunctional DNA-binding transcriptional regulator/antitoxin component of YhaV-PrlF toxin-antitoxin module
MKSSIVSGKGWVVIPRELRDSYRLEKGSKVCFVDYGGVIALVPALKDPIEETGGMLKGDTSLTEALLKSRQEDAGKGK